MTRSQLLTAARKLCSQVAPPYGEDAATQFLHEWLKELGLPFRTDAHGNTVAHVRHAMPKRAMAFAAHLDRPAFRVNSVKGDKATCSAAGRFVAAGLKGARVVFPRGRSGIGGSIERTTTADDSRHPDEVATAVITLDDPETPIQEYNFCVLDIPDPPKQAQGLRVPKGCNLAGCAAIVAGLEHAKQTRSEVDVWAIFTRAGALGFQGAVGAALDGTLPREMLVVAVECVPVGAGIAAGAGPVVALGDASGPFDPRAYTALLGTALDGEKKVGPVQQALLSAHESQAAVFGAFGYASAALGIPADVTDSKKKASPDATPWQIDAGDWAATAQLIGETALRACSGIDDSDARRNDLIRASQAGRELLRVALDTATGYPIRRVF